MSRKKKLTKKEIVLQSALFAIKKTYKVLKYMAVAGSTAVAGAAIVSPEDLQVIYNFIRDMFLQAGCNLPNYKIGVFFVTAAIIDLLYVFTVKFVEKYKELSK